MVIDTSALVAISVHEASADRLLEVLGTTTPRSISAATLQEAFMVIYNRKGLEAWHAMETFLDRLALQIIPVDEAVVRIAMQAFMSYGKGQGSKAKLNYGDCFSYATAKHLNQPLLYIGDDFTHTDIVSAL